MAIEEDSGAVWRKDWVCFDIVNAAVQIVPARSQSVAIRLRSKLAAALRRHVRILGVLSGVPYTRLQESGHDGKLLLGGLSRWRSERSVVGRKARAQSRGEESEDRSCQ